MKWLYKYPQAAFPYADLVEKNRQRDRTQREYELLDTGVFEDDRYFDVFVEYAKATRRRHPDPHHRDQPRPRRRPAAPAADALVPQHLVVGRRRAAPAAARGGLPGRLARDRGRARHPGPALAQRGGRRRAAVHRERLEQAAAVGRAEHLGLRQGRLPRLRHRQPPRGRQSGAGRHQGGRPLPAPDRRRRDRHHLPAPDRRRADARSVRQGVRRDVHPAAARGRRVLRALLADDDLRRRPRRDAPGLRRPAVEQAVLSSRRQALARRRSGRAARRPRRARSGAITSGRTSTTRTSSRCPTSGSTRGTPPGTWRST